MAPTVTSFLRSFNSKLEEPVRQHLKNVYACLTMAAGSAGVGAYVYIYTELLSAGLLTLLGTLGFALALVATPDNGKNTMLRMGYLLGFSFFAGVGMGPLLDVVIDVNPSNVVTALLGTAVIFGSFSLSAFFAERGRWLYLGGTLMTLLNSLLLLSLANLFLGSYLIFQVHLYLGLLVMCGFILYDTQLIIEKRRNGDRDFVTHSLTLFIDFLSIFKRLMIILTEKERQKSKRRD